MDRGKEVTRVRKREVGGGDADFSRFAAQLDHEKQVNCGLRFI